MSALRAWLVLAPTLWLGCQHSPATTAPSTPTPDARVDLIPSSATALVAVDVAAFSSRSYRELLPWLDDPDQPDDVAALRGCYTGEVQTAILGGIFDGPVESIRLAAVLTGQGIGAAPVVACFAKSSEDRLEVWSEDPDTLVFSDRRWSAEVRSKSPRKPGDPLTPVLKHVNTDAHAWFAVRLPPSVDEQLRSGANWLSDLAARSTNNVIKADASATPSREGIGYIAGTIQLDSEGLDGRVLATFETRESVDLAHALIDIAFVLTKHLGASPNTATERLAHEFALHTTISRSGDRIEARTRISAEVLANAAEQAHSTVDLKKMLRLDEGDEVDAARDVETAQTAAVDRRPQSPLENLLAEAATQGASEVPDEVDTDLVYEACDALARHVYPLEECEGELESLLRGDEAETERMLRCVSDAPSQKAVLACDPDRLLNPSFAEERSRKREASKAERALRALRRAFAAAKTKTAKEAIYTQICEKLARLTKRSGDLDKCRAQAKADHRDDRAQFERRSACAMLHDDYFAFIVCVRASER